MVRWLERNGYDVSYFTDVDSDRHGVRDPRAQGLHVRRPRRVLVGRTARERRGGARRRRQPRVLQRQRDLLEDALGELDRRHRTRPTGRSSATRKATPRAAPSTSTAIGTSTATRTRRLDRAVATEPAGRRRRPSRERADRDRSAGATTTAAIQVPAADGKLRLWRNTGHRPAAATLTRRHARVRVRLGRTPRRTRATLPGRPRSRCPDTNVRSGTATHQLTLYRAPSGALVFGAGTIQWSWGLDGTHDRGGSTPDVADAAGDGQPARRHGRPAGDAAGGLIAATASTDTHAPDLDDHLARPTATRSRGRHRHDHRHRDATPGGGVVGGVEVSTDGGATWHPATGRASWTLLLDAARDRARPRSGAAPSTTAATSRRPRPA